MEKMKVALATTNEEKAREVRAALSPFGIRIEHAALEMRESGTDQDAIARQKARQAYKALKRPVIVEDTGVYFAGLDDFPGVLAKRVFLKIGFKGLLEKAAVARGRRAYFKTTLAYCNGKTIRTFEGTLHGTLTYDVDYAGYRKRPKLPYEAFFVPSGEKRRLCGISRREKAKFSHRAKACRKFAKWFSKRIA